MMQPIARTLATLLLTATLAACGDKADDDARQQTTTATDQSYDNIPVEVTVATASERTLASSVELPGITQAFRKARISAETAGRIVTRVVEPGARVETGMSLLEIDPEKARIALEEAQSRSKSSDVALASARSELQRGVDLSKKQFISEDELERLSFAVDAAEANNAAAEAAVSAAQRNFRDAHVEAPFAGTVEKVLVHEGDYVRPGTPLIELADFTRVRLVAGLTGAEAALVMQSGTAEIAFTDIGNGVFEGEIASVGRIADERSGTYPVEVWLEPKEGLVLREGMIATLRLPYASQKTALSVPSSSLFRRKGADYAYKVSDQRAKLQPITKGRVSNGYTEIISGLDSNDRVIIEGLFALRDGSPVSIIAVNP